MKCRNSIAQVLTSGLLTDRTVRWRTVSTVATVDNSGKTLEKQAKADNISSITHHYRGSFEAVERNWKLHTETGFYDLNERKHYFYVKDRLGSTVAVVDDAGRTRQLTAYYPSGVPYDLFGFQRKTDRLHIGNRWLEAAGLFSYDNTARFHYPLIPSFDTPDPLTEKYPQFSPYAHCAGNPLRYVDRDGMDVWEINHRGEIVQRTEDTTQDASHMVDKNGNRINGKELSFPYGSISNSYSAQTNDSGQFQSFDVYELTRDKNGTKLFEFLSDNTSVEWCHIKATDKANKNVNFLTTTHLGNAEYGQAALLNGKLNSGYQVREINHNHPNGTNYPSGLDGEATTDISSSKNVVVHYGDKVSFNIYLSDRKEYIQYSPQSTFYDFPISPVQLKEVVVPYKR